MKKSLKTNMDVLEHILRYCDRIETIIERFGADKNIFLNDIAYRDSISMNLLQIGELSGYLTDDYRNSTQKSMQWSAMKGMRNFFAHNYGEMDANIIWNTAIDDIPQLKAFCEQQINQYNLLNQDAIEPDYDEEEFEQ